MPVYNGEKYLREAVDSILGQTFTDFEFLIIDDGSMDKSWSILNSYDDKRINLIRNSSNFGLTYSLNYGLEVAKGKYIASFAGFVPVLEPVLTILVVVDEPQDVYYGGQVAAPVFQKVAQKALHYMNIEPNQIPGGLTVSRDSEVHG